MRTLGLEMPLVRAEHCASAWPWLSAVALRSSEINPCSNPQKEFLVYLKFMNFYMSFPLWAASFQVMMSRLFLFPDGRPLHQGDIPWSWLENPVPAP